MSLNINVIKTCTDIPHSMTAEIRHATLEDDYQSALSAHVIYGQLWRRAEVMKELKAYWSLRYEIAVIDGIMMKGRRGMPTLLWKRALDQLHVYYVSMEKMRLCTCESMYWININTDIENAIKIAPYCSIFYATQTKDKLLSREIPGRLWECVRPDIFTTDTKHCLCIVHYHCKFPVKTGWMDHCLYPNIYIYMAFLPIGSTQICPRLLS